MDFCFATFAAVSLLFAAATCAPVAPAGHGALDACADVRSSSLELNHQARDVSVEARHGSKDILNFTTSLAWMEAKDMCDPESLRQKPEPCIGKMLDVLTSYNFAVGRLAGFESCSTFVSRVNATMHKLHRDMSKCVDSKAGRHHHKHIGKDTQPIAHWQEKLLCQYTLDRLYSFSVLTARVFAVGDPAHHSEGSTQCK